MSIVSMVRGVAALSVMVGSSVLWAHPVAGGYHFKHVLMDETVAKLAGIPVLARSSETGVVYSVLTPASENRASRIAHGMGRCGSFESLGQDVNLDQAQVYSEMRKLELQSIKEARQLRFGWDDIEFDSKISDAIAEVDVKNLTDTVTWLSSFPSRYNRGSQANKHIEPFVERIEKLVKASRRDATVETIEHRSTKQKTVHLILPGTTHPDEIVVLGAHLDSINISDSDGLAPGADDNASGSANILEALRILLKQKPMARTLEFFWYAGEESGLLGSQEIAKSYREAEKNVIAVLQLDMTLFPGVGEGKIGSATDFTSNWLRGIFKQINSQYLNLKVEDFKCGYGCSDHASWYRQDYPALMPFEATISTYNHAIHTPQDVISPRLNFDHSAQFSKIAIAYAMVLGDSDLKQP